MIAAMRPATAFSAPATTAAAEDKMLQCSSDRKERRVKRLRKVMTYNHVSITEDDYLDVKCVSISDFNVSDNSLAAEFGEPGKLPDKYCRLRALKVLMPPHASRDIEIPLTKGRYAMNLEHMSKRLGFLGIKRPLVVKAWVCNKTQGHSIKTCTKILSSRNPKLLMNFDVPSSDNFSLFLYVLSESDNLTTAMECFVTWHNALDL